MQSTGQTETHDRSNTSMHGSAITYVIRRTPAVARVEGATRVPLRCRSGPDRGPIRARSGPSPSPILAGAGNPHAHMHASRVVPWHVAADDQRGDSGSRGGHSPRDVDALA